MVYFSAKNSLKSTKNVIFFILHFGWQANGGAIAVVPKQGGGWEDISPNNFTVYPPTIWVWSSSATPPIIWLWCTSERRSVLKKSVPFLMKTFYFWSSPEFGEKSVPFLVKSSLNFLTWKKSWSRFILPMLKIGKNWGKIANYPPQCSTKISPPLLPTLLLRINVLDLA